MDSRLDQSAEDTRAIRENVAALNSRLNTLDSKLADISSAVRAIAASAAPPPPPAANGAAAAPAPPAGMTADGLWQNAFRDYSSGKDDLAMSEFTDYLKYFPQTENAAASQFYIGQIYDRAKQYDDAIEAFDAVLERYPDNPKTPDALYMKGVDLQKAGRKADAVTEFKDFLMRYPTHTLASNAQQHIRDLTAKPVPRATKKK